MKFIREYRCQRCGVLFQIAGAVLDDRMDARYEDRTCEHVCTASHRGNGLQVGVAIFLATDSPPKIDRSITLTPEIREMLAETPKIPEDCELVAVNSGEGWHLYVEKEGKEIASLKWPSVWDNKVTPAFLRLCGYKTVG